MCDYIKITFKKKKFNKTRIEFGNKSNDNSTEIEDIGMHFSFQTDGGNGAWSSIIANERPI